MKQTRFEFINLAKIASLIKYSLDLYTRENNLATSSISRGFVFSIFANVVIPAFTKADECEGPAKVIEEQY